MKRIITLSVFALLFSVRFLNAQPLWDWASTSGGSANDANYGVWEDANGNSYVTGSFLSSSITFGSTTLTNMGGLDFYLVKYNSTGSVVWARTATGSNNDVGYNLTGDANGNIYVVGTYNSSSLTFGSTTLTLHGYDDIFIVKYDSNGNVIWANNAGGGLNDIGQSISCDASGNCYITGYFASTSAVFGSTTLTNSGGNEMYIAKYDPSGNALWAKRAGGSANDAGNGIWTDATGNSYVTGSFSSSSITFGSTTFSNGGGSDYFLAKYDSSGTVVWAKNATGTNNDVGYNVTGDNSGNIHVVGTFNSTTLTFASTPLTLSAYDDIFILKYDASGNLAWAKSAGSLGNDIGQSISVDQSGNSYITGYFASLSITFGSTVLTNQGTDNVYVAAYDVSGNVLWAKSTGGANSDRGYAIANDMLGNPYVVGWFTSPSISFSTSFNNVGGNDPFIAKILTNAAGVSETSQPGEYISVFPDPNNGTFTLQLNGTNALNSEFQISIVDMLGREVFHSTSTLQNPEERIDLSAQADGIYHVIVTDGKNRFCNRVVVSR